MSDSVALPWRQRLYLSRLADGVGYGIFAGLAKCSRTRNARYGSGGCLLFDGQRFCQLIEGPEPAVSALWARIADDARHREAMTLLDRFLPAGAEPPPWEYGYCGVDDLEGLDRLGLMHGPAALAAFEAIRGRADLAR